MVDRGEERRIVPRLSVALKACAAGLVVLLIVGGGGVAGATSATTKGAATPHRGGTLRVLESAALAGAWPLGLDPATNTSDAADSPYMDAIYGTLFDQGAGGKIIPNLATGYKFSSDLLTVSIFLRHGVVFSDGTPFNAQAVAYNITQDLLPQYANIADPFFPVASITTPDSYTVELHLKHPFTPIIAAFPAEAPNWIASPTAVQKMGLKQFALTPVGAGPFTVVKDIPNAELVVKRNPSYWDKGKPYLDGIDFKVVSNDNSAYDALTTGGGDVEQFFGLTSLVSTAKKTLQVVSVPPLGMADIQLNTAVPPFNNILAREAVYYAVDQKGISRALSYGTGIVSQSPSFPGSLLYMPKVPGYRTYNINKAKALVQQLGGLSFTYDYGPFGNGTLIATALQADFKRAGMDVKLNPLNTLQAILEAFSSNKWQSIGQGGGGVNPAVGAGSMGWRYLSTGPFTGVHDPALDKLINQATSTLSVSQQKAIYRRIFTYISDKAYSPFIYASPGYTISTHSVHGPGISSNQLAVIWPDIWMNA